MAGAMINSRSLDDLAPDVARAARMMLEVCEREGIQILITSTFRDHESQAKLYAQGRTAPGRIVTNAKPGESFHNYRVAFDVVPLRDGKPVWDDDDPIWRRVGEIGERCGLEWAGRWKTFREYPHFQRRDVTLAELKGETLTA